MSNETITIRLNDEERAQLERIKAHLNLIGQFGGDSKAMKACLNFTENVIHGWFGGNMGALFYRKKPNQELENDKKAGTFGG